MLHDSINTMSRSQWQCGDGMRFVFKFIAALLVAGVFSKCPLPYEPWLHGRCLLGSPTAVTYDEAKQACAAMNGTLASIHSAEENKHIGAATKDYTYHIFIGLGCNSTTNQFQWLDGSPLDFTNFQNGPPSSCSDLPEVLLESSTGIWTAYASAGYNSYVCEYPRDDEYPCDQGYDYVKDAALCVQKGDAAATWNSAEAFCQDSDPNSHLVSIHSNKTNDAISAYAIAKGIKSGIHIGLHKSRGELAWKDATPYDYNEFRHGMPVDAIGTCVALQPQTAQWLSVNCERNDLLPFLCVLPAFLPATRLNPPGCPVSAFYNGRGEISSPGYPISIETGGAVCDYFLYGDEGTHVSLVFDVFELNVCCDSLEIYDNVLAEQPTTVLTGELTPGYEIDSSTGNIFHLVLKIGDGRGVRGFHGRFTTN